jgi:hypothetical protein
MPTLPPDRSPDVNPYAPPEANLGEMPVASAELTVAELIRETYIAHETSIRAIGFLQQIGGGVLLGLLVLFIAVAIAPSTGSMGRSSPFIHGLVVYLAFLAVISFTLGFGLRSLRSWARWITAVLVLLSLLATLGGLAFEGVRGDNMASVAGRFVGTAIIPSYILYLLFCPKANMVFSPEYQAIIAQTPHVKLKTNWLAKGCLIALVAFLTLAIMAALWF